MQHQHSSGSVRILPRRTGDAVWSASIRPPIGKQFTKVIGRVWTQKSVPPPGYLNRRQADGVLRGMLVEADHGRLTRQQAVGITFKSATDEWLHYVEHDRRRSPTTVRDYKSSVRSVLLPHFDGGTALNAITAQHIDSFRLARAMQGNAPATVNKHLRILHSIFKHAVKHHGLRQNPVAGVERQPHENSGDFTVLSPSEVYELADAAQTKQEEALYITAAFTGLRLGELRALRWGDLDFTTAVLHVRWNHPCHATEAKRPKGKKVRSVPLLPEVAGPLDALSRREHFTSVDDLVFPNEVGRPVDYSKLGRAYRQALSQAALKPMRFHDLRHTFGTLAVQVWELPKVQGYTGHTDIQTTMRYVHHRPKHDDAHKLSALIRREMRPELLVVETPENVG